MKIEKEIVDDARKFGWALATLYKKKNVKSTSLIDFFGSVSDKKDLIEAIEKSVASMQANGMTIPKMEHILNQIDGMSNEKAVVIARLIAIEGYKYLSYGNGNTYKENNENAS